MKNKWRYLLMKLLFQIDSPSEIEWALVLCSDARRLLFPFENLTPKVWLPSPLSKKAILLLLSTPFLPLHFWYSSPFSEKRTPFFFFPSLFFLEFKSKAPKKSPLSSLSPPFFSIFSLVSLLSKRPPFLSLFQTNLAPPPNPSPLLFSLLFSLKPPQPPITSPSFLLTTPPFLIHPCTFKYREVRWWALSCWMKIKWAMKRRSPLRGGDRLLTSYSRGDRLLKEVIASLAPGPGL